MFCPGCGMEDPAQAVFCLKCGANLPQFVAGQGFVAPPPAVPGIPTPPAPLPYLWGYIHGWGMLVGSPLFFLLFLAVLVAPESDPRPAWAQSSSWCCWRSAPSPALAWCARPRWG